MAINNEPTIEPRTITGIFTKYIAKTIPLAFDESMSYYECLCALLEYINEDIVPDINNVNDGLQELQDYVLHYFDNLDVQEEINNKLDEMAEDGTLQEIIADYLDSKAVFGFDTVAELKAATNLLNGSYAETLGYYSKNDGGSALYKIRTVTNEDNVDDMFIVELNDNTLVAELIIKDDTINIKQLGARSQATDNTKYDIKDYIDAYIDKQNELKKQLKLYIPFGIWYTSGNLFYGRQGLFIYGDENFAGFDTFGRGTVITSYSNNQDYIFRLGDSSHDCHNWVLKNIIFSSSDYEYDTNVYKFKNFKSISKALELHYAEYGVSDNLFFYYINGNCLTINASWENYFKLLNFRKVSIYEKGIINFESADSSLTLTANVTANTFEKIMFERVHGHLINLENDCRVYNNHFGVINCEPNQLVLTDEVYGTFTSENIDTFNDNTLKHFAIFNMENGAKFGENVINSMELNNYGLYYFSHNSNVYTYDTLTYMGNNVIHANIYNIITLNGGYKAVKAIYLPSTITDVSQTTNYSTFNYFVTDNHPNGLMFDVNGLAGIYGDTLCTTGTTPSTYLDPSIEIYQYGGWIPCYKAKPKRSYVNNTGLGSLFYDEDSYNNLKLIVKPRTENNNLDRGVFSTVVGPNKKFAVRAKVPIGETCRLIIANLIDSSKNITLACEGDGTYKIYEANLSTLEVGNKLLVTVSSNTNYQRNINCDVFISV